MKTADEIKKGLEHCGGVDIGCTGCPYDDYCRNQGNGESPEMDAINLIDQLQSTYRQLSKALCGKENATQDELLQAVSQLKKRLAQVERERDAMIHDFMLDSCETCIHGHTAINDCMVPMKPCIYEWRGACDENTKED